MVASSVHNESAKVRKFLRLFQLDRVLNWSRFADKCWHLPPWFLLFSSSFPNSACPTQTIRRLWCWSYYVLCTMYYRTMVLANYLFSLGDINLKLGLLPPRRHVVWRDSVGVESSGSELKSECADILHQSFLVVTLYWRAPTRAKQLSMATIPLCFEFFRCRVDVLQS